MWFSGYEKRNKEVIWMPCNRKKPTYSSKKDAKRHGAISYGKGNYQVRKVKDGYKAYKKWLRWEKESLSKTVAEEVEELTEDAVDAPKLGEEVKEET